MEWFHNLGMFCGEGLAPWLRKWEHIISLAFWVTKYPILTFVHTKNHLWYLLSWGLSSCWPGKNDCKKHSFFTWIKVFMVTNTFEKCMNVGTQPHSSPPGAVPRTLTLCCASGSSSHRGLLCSSGRGLLTGWPWSPIQWSMCVASKWQNWVSNPGPLASWSFMLQFLLNCPQHRSLYLKPTALLRLCLKGLAGYSPQGCKESDTT